jgi:Fic family protein
MAQATYIWQRPGWPKIHVQESALSGAIGLARQEQGKVIGLAQAIGVPGMAQVNRDIWIDEAMATAAIEGEKLDMASVRSSVMRRLGMPNDVRASASRSVDGLLDVMQDATASYQNALDDDRLFRWQAALFPAGTSGIYRITVGKYRDSTEPMQIVSGPAGHETVHYQAPPSAAVPKQMRLLLQWFESTKPQTGSNLKIDGIVRAALAHLWFESIHPFEDGNGRVGRAIVDMALAQDAATSQRLYSMASQLMKERDAYYQHLGEAQRGKLDVTPWVVWFVTQFRFACIASQNVISVVVEKNRFWATHSAIAINDRQRKALMLLLDAGDGGFRGGMSASKYVSITRTSKTTATRDLAELEKAGLVVATGQGRATRYWVNVPVWKIGDPEPDTTSPARAMRAPGP